MHNRAEIERMRELKVAGHTESEIAQIMGLRTPVVRSIFAKESEQQINWRFNCLTDGVHDGRPEKIWNLPLLQTTHMFSPVQLQQLVVDRIYNDAMEMVRHGVALRQKETDAVWRFDQAWAEEVKEIAAPRVLPVYQNKVGEITTYYRTVGAKRDFDDVIERNKENKLNPFYEPLHGHDTLNMLCRIVGTNADRKARVK